MSESALEFMARMGPAPVRWTHDFYKAPEDEAILEHFKHITNMNKLTLMRVWWTKDRAAAAITIGAGDVWVGCVRAAD